MRRIKYVKILIKDIVGDREICRDIEQLTSSQDKIMKTWGL